MSAVHVARIDFQRIQGFLFRVPRLRVMVGANRRLGEVIRRELPELARCGGSALLAGVGGPPSLAGDPIVPRDHLDRDDPAWMLQEYGVLARDGGHFRAVFESDSQARAFVAAAEALLRDRLPDLVARTSVRPMTEAGDLEVGAAPPRPATERFLADLPILQVCQETGRGPASAHDAARGVFRSNVVEDLRAEGAAGRASRDVVGLLRPALPLADERAPADLEDLCGSGYLAVVHADGNAIGSGRPRHGSGASWLDAWAADERYFQGVRVRLRHAVAAALSTVFAKLAGQVRHRPYQLLMLGGDDMLLACEASSAFDVAVELARELARPDAPGTAFTVGVGVAVAGATVPFRRLVEMAEDLSASAKRRSRARSVVDWHAFTQSWSEDLTATRRRDMVRLQSVGGSTERLLLSVRPLDILDREGGDWSLEWLQARARLLKDGAARSQLRALVPRLAESRGDGELAFRELPNDVREPLQAALRSTAGPWESLGQGRWRTAIPDLVELTEVPRLGGGRSRRSSMRAESR